MSAIQFASPTTPSTATEESSNPKPAKRRRVNLACERCRNRKSRCDGKQPICENCEKAKAECIYREPAWHTRTQDDFDHERVESEHSQQHDSPSQSALEERMRAMEERLRKFESAPVEGDSIGAQKSGRGDETVVEGHGLTTDAQSPNAVDAMGTVSFADEQDSAFFGPSSNIAFLAHITKAVKATQDPSFSNHQMQSDSDAAIVNAHRPGRKHKQPSPGPDAGDAYALPSEKEVLDLAQEFFNNTGLLFPYVHADSFYQTYARVKSKSSKSMRLSWLALCNMIFANAVSSEMRDSRSIRKRVEKAEVFYKRGTTLLRQVDDQGMSLEKVQSLLLATQYLQGTQRSVQTYTVHGKAVRAAFSLGLHSPDTLRRFSSLEQEMRKRTWHACVMLDRNLSMTFGRPPSIPESFVKLPTPNAFQPSQASPSTTPAHSIVLKCLGLGFFNATIALYRIMSEVLEKLYGQNIGDGDQDSLASMLAYIPDIEAKLQMWTDSQLEYLRSQLSSDQESKDLQSTRRRLINILDLRRLNLRNLLHRPILQRLLGACAPKSPHEIGRSPGLHAYVKASLESLTASSRDLIKLHYENRGSKRAVGAWWYSLYYTFNSALILVGVHIVRRAHLIPDLNETDSIHEMLDLAVDTLAILDKGNMMVERCRLYLQKLVRAVLHPRARHDSSTNLSQATTGQSPGTRRSLYSYNAAAIHSEPPVAFDYSDGFTQGAFPPYGMHGDTNDLDIGPFLANGNLDFLPFMDDQQMLEQPQGMM